ncbi:J domain-containing protein, partial [Trichostrongylus colubriformis]
MFTYDHTACMYSSLSLLQCMLAGRHHGYQALGRKPQLLQRIALGLRSCNQDDSLSSDSSSQDTNVLRAGSPDLLVLDLEEQKQIMDWYSVSTERSASVDGPRSEVSDRSTAPSDVTTDFFQTLDWSQTQHTAQHSASPVPPPVPAHRHSPVPPVPPARGVRQAADPFTAVTTSTSSSRSVSNPRGMETFETYDGIRIHQSKEDPDADMYRFDSDKETPILNASSPCGVTSEFDLLGLGESSAPPPAPPTTAPGELAKPVLDPFFDLINDNWSAPLESTGTAATTAPTAAAAPPHAATTDALLGEWSGTSNLLNVGNPSSIHRNVSAPVFQPSSSNFDPFAEFLSQSTSNPASAQESASNSGSTTPMPSRPNYSRTAFENMNSGTTAPKAKVTGDAFGDLLSSH